MNNRIIFRTPKVINERSIKSFIHEVQNVFLWSGKRKQGFYFDVSNTADINILGVLLIYKFLDYAVQKQCFKDPQTNLGLKSTDFLNRKLKETGFKKLVSTCFKDTVEIEDFLFKEVNECFIAPTVLKRKSAISEVGINNQKQINEYYRFNGIIAASILMCFGEISSNFQEHAEDDTKSVIVAKGNRAHFEIACADTGIGIISTLKDLAPQQIRKSPYQILNWSIKKGISSKLEDGHMGCGLWLVNEFVTQTKGYLCIYSENGYLINRAGKIKCGEGPFWKGTAIYVDIPLTNTDKLRDVIKSIKPKNQYI